MESRPCTAFVTDKGQYQLKRLPMGLKISPSAFSRLMTVENSGLSYESCFTYINDLILFGRNLETHNANLVKVLERLREVNLKLNPNKCEFLKKSLLYLGHKISAEGIKLKKGCLFIGKKPVNFRLSNLNGSYQTPLCCNIQISLNMLNLYYERE